MPTSRPPGPRGTLLYGCLASFMGDRLNFLRDCARTYGDLTSFRLGPRRVLLAAHPDLAEQVFVADARHYIKHFGARMYKPVLGEGLVTSEGDLWLRQRRLAQPAFARAKIDAYAPVMVELAQRMLDRWQPGQQRDIYLDMSELTGAIALRVFFGIDDDAQRLEYNDALDQAFNLMGARIRRLIRWPDWVPLPSHLHLRRTVRRLDGLIDGFLDKSRRRQPPGDDLLARYLHARDIDGSRMTDRQLRDEAMTLYLAGHETTALLLSWTWWLLAHHPRVEDELAAEWRRVLNGRPPTPADLPSLPVTEHVIAESLRIRPPVYLIGREATRDLELGGYRVPRGTTVFLSQWVAHHDERWFPEPDRFLPSRWTGGLAARLPKYAYYPFGGGPRVCIGNAFALLEAALLLPTIGQRWCFRVNPYPTVRPRTSITLTPEPGIPAMLVPRADPR